MTLLRLTGNEQKTRRCCLPEDTFTFLGYTFGRCYSHRTGGAYIGPRPFQPCTTMVADVQGGAPFTRPGGVRWEGRSLRRCGLLARSGTPSIVQGAGEVGHQHA